MEASEDTKRSSHRAAAAGAAAGVALVALVAVGWWLGGAETAQEHSAAPPALDAAPRASATPAAPHGEGEPGVVEDAETRRLRAEVAADPDRIEPRRQLALRLLRLGSFYGAYEEAERLLDRAPDDVDGLFVVAAVRVRMGQPSRALPLLDEVLARSPDHVPALTAKGQALAKAGHDAAAIEIWRRAIELSGGSNRQVEELLRSVEEGSSQEPVAGS